MKKCIVTRHLVTRWFNIYNEKIFDNRLIPLNDIIISNMRNCDAKLNIYFDSVNDLMWSNLHVKPYYKSKQYFKEILVHEMIHHFQWTVEKIFEVVHNKGFFK